MVTQLGWQHRQSSSDPAWRFSSNISFELTEYICTMYNRRQNLKTCLNKNRGMFANLAGTGAQPFCRYVSSASRAGITGDGKVSSLAPDPSMPQVPPARECCIQERKSEKQKKEFQKRRKPGNNSAHDCMRTWLHSALSSPAGHQGLSHVQQNYTD